MSTGVKYTFYVTRTPDSECFINHSSVISFTEHVAVKMSQLGEI